jgi:hypothetical protein
MTRTKVKTASLEQPLIASQLASTIPLSYTNSSFGNGWSLAAPASTTYYKLATLPASSNSTFDDMVIEGVIGGWGSVDKQPFKICFANRNGFNYEYDSYGTVQSFAKIIGISTNNTVEIWAQHGANLYTTLTYSISNSIQVNVVSNPTPTTTAPVGTTVFDSSSATYNPRISIDNSGRVTMPYQPTFYVEKPFGATNTFVSGNTTAITTWSNVRLNQGSHFSLATGRFTAPVAGIYMFTFHISYGIGANSISDFLFYKNGTGASETVVAKNGAVVLDWANGALIAHISLAVNDYVTVGAASYSGNAGNMRASFGGRLVG